MGLFSSQTGLPFMERLLSGRYIRRHCKQNSEAELCGKFERETERLLALCAEFRPEDLQKPVSIGRIPGIEEVSKHWSAAMTLAHLNQVNQGMLFTITTLESGEGEIPEVDIASFKPVKNQPDEITQLFSKNCDNFLAKVRALSPFDNKRTHVHPWFGPFSAQLWLGLAGLHMAVHRKQILAIQSVIKG